MAFVQPTEPWAFGDPREQLFFDSLMLRDSSRKEFQCHTGTSAIVRLQPILDLGRLDPKLRVLVDECLELGPQIGAYSIEHRKEDILFHCHMRVERGDEEEKFTDRVRRPVFIDSPIQISTQRVEALVLRFDPPFFAAHLHSETFRLNLARSVPSEQGRSPRAPSELACILLYPESTTHQREAT